VGVGVKKKQGEGWELWRIIPFADLYPKDQQQQVLTQ